MAFLYLISLAVLVAPALGYSAGAPKAACGDMVPQHHIAPQSSPAPYQIAPNKAQLKGGESVDLTIKGNSPSDTIKGFMVQARIGDKPVGRFDVKSSNGYAQTLTCNNADDTVTHKKIEGNGPNSITVTWIPPKDLKGDVQFRATIALNGGVFWVGKLSSPLLLS